MPKRVEVGIVTSDKTPKSRRVEIPRLVKHKKYGKYLRRRTVCHVHDEREESHAGDTVEIVECAPKSKLKRWELVRVVKKSQVVDVAALRAASRRKADSEQTLLAGAAPSQSATNDNAPTESPSPEKEGG
jgi:small subunit ribosomal protein S17